MVNKWYVITRAGPGTRLGIYDNWPEVAEKVLDVRGSVYQGYRTEAEAISVWERAQARAQAGSGDANNGTGSGSGERQGRGEAQNINSGASPRANNSANGNVNVGRGRTRTHISERTGTAHSGAPSSSNNTIVNGPATGTRNSTRTHSYPSPEPSVQRAGASTRNHRHRSRGRSISLSSEPEESRPRVSVDTSISSRTGDRVRTRTPVSPSANPPSRMTARGTPREQRSHTRIRSISMRSPKSERPKAGPVRAQVSMDTYDRNMTRTRTHRSGSGCIQLSGDTSFATAKSDRTRSWVAEISVVLPSVPEFTQTRIRVGARANGVRDDPQRVRETTTPSAVRSTGRSPPAPSPWATVDTSYAQAISISSSSSPSEAAQRRELRRHSRLSRSPRMAPQPSSNSTISTENGPEIYQVDPSTASQSPRASSYRTASSSPPTEITPAESTKASPLKRPTSRENSASRNAGTPSRRDGANSASSPLPLAEVIKVEPLKSGPSQRPTSFKTRSVPQSPSVRAGTSLRQDALNSTSTPVSPVEVVRVESLNQGPLSTAGSSGGVRQSPSTQAGTTIPRDTVNSPAEPASPRITPPRTPTRSSRTNPRVHPQTLEQRNPAVSQSVSLYSGLICRSRSNTVTAFGFTEAPHVANGVYSTQVDPRSPRRREGTRNLAQPGPSDGLGRPSPLISEEPTFSSLFST